MSTHAMTFSAGVRQEQESRSENSAIAVMVVAVVFSTALFSAAAVGVGGGGGSGVLLRFREDGPVVGAMGLVVLALFAASLAMTCGALAGGGRQSPHRSGCSVCQAHAAPRLRSIGCEVAVARTPRCSICV